MHAYMRVCIDVHMLVSQHAAPSPNESPSKLPLINATAGRAVITIKQHKCNIHPGSGCSPLCLSLADFDFG